MAISVVRLGMPRKTGEGLRIGTVRRPPRGVPKSEFAKRGFYDVWLPELSPSADLVGVAMHSELDESVEAVRAEVSRGDEAGVASAGFAGGAFSADEFFCGVLLRARGSLSSVDSEEAARGARGEGGVAELRLVAAAREEQPQVLRLAA